MALLRGGAAAFDGPREERHAERLRRVARDDGRLVEAALDVARPVQGHGQDEFRQRPRHSPPLASDQEPEQPPAGCFTVKLERAHAMINRVSVAIRRDQQIPRSGDAREMARRECIGRQITIAAFAQVERATTGIDAARRAAKQARGRQA